MKTILPTESTNVSQISVEENPHGGLIVSYTAQESPEKASSIHLITQERNSGHWGSPTTAVATTKKNDGYGVLYLDPRGDLRLIFSTQDPQITETIPLRTDWAASQIFMQRSHNYGRTWNDPVLLCPEQMGWLCSSRPLSTETLRQVVPLCDPLIKRSLALLSDDLFLNSHPSQYIETIPLNLPEEEESFDPDTPYIPTYGNTLPSITSQPDGSLLALLPSLPAGSILQASSYDRGMTWTETRPTSLSCPGTSIDSIILSEENLDKEEPSNNSFTLVVHNDSETDQNSLGFSVSPGDNKWLPLFQIEESSKAIFHDPRLIQSRDGALHLLYGVDKKEIKHVCYPIEWFFSQIADKID